MNKVRPGFVFGYGLGIGVVAVVLVCVATRPSSGPKRPSGLSDLELARIQCSNIERIVRHYGSDEAVWAKLTEGPCGVVGPELTRTGPSTLRDWEGFLYDIEMKADSVSVTVKGSDGVALVARTFPRK